MSGRAVAWLLAAGALLVLMLAWWGWQRGGMALLQLGMGQC
ncbi:hypothetical protein [Pseudomonas cremoricolorata]|nr:hypothetical protein [Pseudomonas cremoricolorata]